MMNLQSFLTTHRLLFALFWMVFLLSGCTIKMVADYDAATFEEILKVAKRVDKFYGDLLETKQNERPYQKFSAQYVEIETDIRALVTRNKVRPLNEQSTKISETILNFWLKYKETHKQNEAEKKEVAYSDGNAKFDRGRFAKLFAAAASAEQAKKLDADDKDNNAESK